MFIKIYIEKIKSPGGLDLWNGAWNFPVIVLEDECESCPCILSLLWLLLC